MARGTRGVLDDARRLARGSRVPTGGTGLSAALLRFPRRFTALLAAIAIAAGACTGDDGSPDADPLDGPDRPETTSIAAAFDLRGLDVRGGSKDFAEQVLLSAMLALVLDEAGATVVPTYALGGTIDVREALLDDEIDAYFEYTGIGWLAHLDRPDPADDAEELFDALRAADHAEHDVIWVGRSAFNDTYGFAVADGSRPLDLDAMAARLERDPDLTVCVDREFAGRTDGLDRFETATGVEVPDRQVEVVADADSIYEEVAAGFCDFGEVFTTDGRVAEHELQLVEDPGVFIIHNASLTIRADVYARATRAFDAIAAAILTDLDTSTMAELNRRVTIGGEDALAVAADHLVSRGVIGG